MAAGALRLDEVMAGLETNGVLVDRSAAVSAGLKGILLSIDPGVEIDAAWKNPEMAPVPSVAAVELWPENLAYIKVSGLPRGSGEEILAHLKALSARWGVLLDVRGAGGEDLEPVGILAGLIRNRGEPLFILSDNRGVVLATNGVSGSYSKMPLLILLIDGKTSGAAQALAAVFKGSPGVLLIGTATQGERWLRSWIPLPDGGMAKLRTREWALVGRVSCLKDGVSPDIAVSPLVAARPESRYTNATNRILSPKSEADRDLMDRVAGDDALQRGTDMLLGLQALGGYGYE